jgi:hypothetical protein
MLSTYCFPVIYGSNIEKAVCERDGSDNGEIIEQLVGLVFKLIRNELAPSIDERRFCHVGAVA